MTREIARRFNYLYGKTFLVTSEVSTLVDTDGHAKASKPLGNVIHLSDSADEVRSPAKPWGNA